MACNAAIASRGAGTSMGPREGAKETGTMGVPLRAAMTGSRLSMRSGSVILVLMATTDSRLATAMMGVGSNAARTSAEDRCAVTHAGSDPRDGGEGKLSEPGTP